MSENQTNQSTPPEEGGHRFEANIPNVPDKKAKRGSFAADGPTPHQDTAPVKKESGTPPLEKVSAPIRPVKLPVDKSFEWMRLAFLVVFIVPLGIWASLPSWQEIVYAWWNTPDYCHGFAVLPLVAFFLYVRRDSYPGTVHNLTWIGLFPIVVYGAMRYVAGLQYMDAVDQWSIFFWILGVVWFFYGSRVFLWALPSLCFLLFMFQLPWSFEVLMRNHLQAFAAQFAAVLLQLLGEPAIPIKNTIRLSTMELGVEAACSGIRFMISILAIAFAAVLLFRRPWWQNIFVIAFAPPLALFVNAARIAMTGILLVHFQDFVVSITPEGQTPSVVADDVSGKVFIVIAVVMFFAFIGYLEKVFKRVTI
jgi:exosortase